MKISVIVPAFNEGQFLGKTLAQIKVAAGANVVFEPVNQISRARNSGATAATGDWLVFVDADSQPSAEVFADMA